MGEGGRELTRGVDVCLKEVHVRSRVTVQGEHLRFLEGGGGCHEFHL